MVPLTHHPQPFNSLYNYCSKAQDSLEVRSKLLYPTSSIYIVPWEIFSPINLYPGVILSKRCGLYQLTSFIDICLKKHLFFSKYIVYLYGSDCTMHTYLLEIFDILA